MMDGPSWSSPSASPSPPPPPLPPPVAARWARAELAANEPCPHCRGISERALSQAKAPNRIHRSMEHDAATPSPWRVAGPELSVFGAELSQSNERSKRRGASGPRAAQLKILGENLHRVIE
ncbi:unnamed protein product [Phyllotreta striolata]|uniref:Uncharacterized protein n=1 Tax=Phyllotreta striolata TaxID=444603 RepID=A0A9N9TXL3_PHYSR|nr:unnamed protein product [Phyllotreta striolata]